MVNGYNKIIFYNGQYQLIKINFCLGMKFNSSYGQKIINENQQIRFFQLSFSQIIEYMENKENGLQTHCSCSLISFNYKIQKLAPSTGKSKVLSKKSASKGSQSNGKKSKISLSKSSSSISGLLENQISVNGSDSQQKQYSPAQKDAHNFSGSYKLFETQNYSCKPSQNKNESNRLRKRTKHQQTRTINLEQKESQQNLQRTKNTNTNFETSTVYYPNGKNTETNNFRMFDTISFSMHDKTDMDKDFEKTKDREQIKQNKCSINLQRISKMQPVQDTRVRNLYQNFAESKILTNFVSVDEARKIKTLKELGYKQAESSGGGTSQNHLSMVMSLEQVKSGQLKGLDNLAKKSCSFTKLPKNVQAFAF